MCSLCTASNHTLIRSCYRADLRGATTQLHPAHDMDPSPLAGRCRGLHEEGESTCPL